MGVPDPASEHCARQLIPTSSYQTLSRAANQELSPTGVNSVAVLLLSVAEFTNSSPSITCLEVAKGKIPRRDFHSDKQRPHLPLHTRACDIRTSGFQDMVASVHAHNLTPSRAARFLSSRTSHILRGLFASVYSFGAQSCHFSSDK